MHIISLKSHDSETIHSMESVIKLGDLDANSSFVAAVNHTISYLLTRLCFLHLVRIDIVVK